MAFPQDPLDVRAEMKIGGVWTNTTAYTYIRNPISIERGRKDEGQRTDPSKCGFTLNNRDGRFSPLNPMSPYYGLIGRNTPLRFSVPGTESYLALTGQSADIASTPDHATLDIVGDIDLRVEAAVDWYTARVQTLIGKWDSSINQRSFMLLLVGGALELRFSPDGVGSFFAGRSLPALPRRAAVRATVDVDNGAGGWTARLYWAESLDGPWTQFGTDAVVATPTSIFASTAPLQIAPSSFTITPNWLPVEGGIHRAEVRNGINGPVVASPDHRALAPGTTSFADSAGRTWTVNGQAEISNRRFRIQPEASSFPNRWDVSGQDVYMPIEAAGILRRLGQGAKALQSTLRRRIPSDPNLVAYWPLEEARDAKQAYSPIPGIAPMAVSGLDFAADDTLAGSSALPKLKNPSTLRASVPQSSKAGWQCEFVYYLAALPAAQTEVMRVTVAGSVMRTAVVYASTAGIRIEARDADDAVIVFVVYSDATALASFVGVWNRLSIYTGDAGGGQTRLQASWRDVVTNTRWYASTIFTGAQGAVTGLRGTWGSGLAGMAFGHLSVFDIAGTGASGSPPPSTIYDLADTGFAGETALSRINRLATEESASVALSWIDGDNSFDSERMGPQRPAPLLTLLEECAEADGGILYESRDKIGLIYRDRSSLYNQEPALTLNYAANGEVAPPLDPVDDDQRVRNDITVTRVGGSSGRAVLEAGPLSIQAPPGGVGIYDESVTVNLYNDAQPEQHAGWRLHLGTWNEARYPQVHVDLAAAPHLVQTVLALDIGDKLRIINPPPWLPPGPIDLIVEGYAETIGHPNDWDIVFNCSPAGPWEVGVRDDATLGRRDTAGSSLAAAIDAAATALTVATTVGPVWTEDPAHMPITVRAGGEEMTVSAITGAVVDAFGRTVSSGWGSADVGGAWTTGGGSASDYAVGSGIGTHTMTTVNVSRRCLVAAPAADVDLITDIATSVLSTGDSQTAGLVARVVDASNLYQARVAFTTAAGVVLSLRKRIAAAETELATFTTTLTHVAGTFVRLRMQVAGSELRAKIWAVTDAEPSGWQVTATDTDLPAAGSVGVRSILGAANTNVNPVARYDNLACLNPQRFTAVRSVNAIVKSHAAGTALSLRRPAVRAL
ncbi:hypothetical protein NLX86_06705 [Streptomyces sp. A3M-1-3]|uniref:hypothetical protein n=1 Tax=Streptomyces sp. A3M-1-3 TaxID=2962044 RepID=UPI0020B87379|nr:hypothetical protein [Streptomyces sp. A3M-1-3]MCP3817837.1 hypothetical protein [Streptomyces sp. A3M-1-3]